VFFRAPLHEAVGANDIESVSVLKMELLLQSMEYVEME
jgi:hypothetical protein